MEVHGTCTPQEFGNGTSEAGDGKGFAAALNSTNADGTTKAETVVRIHSNSHDHDGNATSPLTGSTGPASTDGGEPMDNSIDRFEGLAVAAWCPLARFCSLNAQISSLSNLHLIGAVSLSLSALEPFPNFFSNVLLSRIIDSHDNEFVLSKPSTSLAALTLDPQLITDLTVVLGASASLGAVFEGIRCEGHSSFLPAPPSKEAIVRTASRTYRHTYTLRQPIINGYLIAGALVGPGGLNAIKVDGRRGLSGVWFAISPPKREAELVSPPDPATPGRNWFK